jgi:hypothetical protein
MNRRLLRWILILGGTCLLSACAVATTTPSSTQLAPVMTVTQATLSTPLQPTSGIGAGTPTPEAARAAIEDLAGRTGLPASSIQIMSIAPETWPNPSLGCPKPGVLYAQVITRGYRVVLSAGGALYEYHTDQGTRAVTCLPPNPTTPGVQSTTVGTISPVGTYSPGDTKSGTVTPLPAVNPG